MQLNNTTTTRESQSRVVDVAKGPSEHLRNQANIRMRRLIVFNDLKALSTANAHWPLKKTIPSSTLTVKSAKAVSFGWMHVRVAHGRTQRERRMKWPRLCECIVCEGAFFFVRMRLAHHHRRLVRRPEISLRSSSLRIGRQNNSQSYGV